MANYIGGIPDIANKAESAARMLELFAGREGVFAQQTGSGAYVPVRPERDLTIEDIVAHLEGARSYAIYPVMKDNTCRFICFDVDLGREEAETAGPRLPELQKQLLPTLRAISSSLSALGVGSASTLFEDTGGRGFHIWLFFESPISAGLALKLGRALLDRAGVQCEVFPKQGSVSPDRYGNPIKLPLGVHRRYGRRSHFVTLGEEAVPALPDPLATLAAARAIGLPQVNAIARDLGVLGRPQAAVTQERALLPARVRTAENHGQLFTRCIAMSRIRERLARGENVGRDCLFALGATLAHIEGGETYLHELLRPWPRYDRSITSRQFQSLQRSQVRPPSCRWLVEHEACDGYCDEEIAQAAEITGAKVPSPIRFATWRDETEVDSLLQKQDVSYERIYARANLYRAWQQVLQHIREEDVVNDAHEFHSFQANLDCNIECLRQELIDGQYRPQAYRIVRVPKAKGAEGFEFREKVLLHPRDHVVVQAILNIIGPTFEADFSNASLGRRLELREGAGPHVFRPWQTDWQRNKHRILSFQHHPLGHHYLRADITKFFDRIDHTRLLGKLAEKLSAEPRIVELARLFLANAYLDDDGSERPVGSRDVGIPQGPAFSAFLANVYLDSVDKRMEKRCVDYVRYVDDIAFVARSRDEALELKGALSGYLGELGLNVHPTKTSPPTPVSDAAGLYDLLGEIKYGAAGLLSRPTVWEQQPMPELWDLAEDLKGIEQFDTHRLDEMGKHLRLYLDLRRELTGGENDETAVRLAQRAIEACALRPRDLLTCVQIILSRFGTSAESIKTEILEKISHDYGRNVLAQALGWPQQGVDQGAASEVLRELSRHADSYLVRGFACASLRLLRRPISETDLTGFVAREASPFVKARAIASTRYSHPQAATVAVSAAFGDGDLHVCGSAAEVALDSRDPALIGNLVSAWARKPQDRLLLPQVVQAAIQAANSDSIMVLEINLADRPPDLVRSLFRLSLGLMPDVFQRRPDGQVGFLALASVQAGITDEALATILARELQMLLPPQGDVQAIDAAAVRSERERLSDTLRVATGDRLVPRFFSDYDGQRPIRELSGHVKYYIAARRASGTVAIVECVTMEVVAESAAVDSMAKWAQVLNSAREANLCATFDSWEDDQGRWTAYEVPSSWRTLAEALSDGRTYTLDEVLAITDAAFSKLSTLRQLGAPDPSVSPFGVIVGPGNEIRLTSLLGGLPAPRYVSHAGGVVEDSSKTNMSNFAGLLSFELLTNSCPARELENLQPDWEEKRPRLSDSGKLEPYPQHYAWILDRLTRPKPDQRYRGHAPFAEDCRHFRRFRKHCEENLANREPAEVHTLETLDVLSLRIARELTARLAEGQSLHVIALGMLHAVCDRLRRAQQAASKKGIRWEPRWLRSAESLGTPWKLRRWAHVSARLCLELASGVVSEKAALAPWSGWTLPAGEAALIALIPLRIEAVALLRGALGAAKSWDDFSNLTESERSIARKLWAIAATPSEIVEVARAGGSRRPAVEIQRQRWDVSTWADTADVLSELAEKQDPSVVESQRLPALIAAAGLLLGDISLTAPNSNSTVENPRADPNAGRRKTPIAWARLLAAASEAEELLYRILTGYETCDDEQEKQAITAITACLSGLRSVQVGRRCHAVVAERFKPVGASLKIRRRHSRAVMPIHPDSLLRFPRQHLESFRGEPVSFDVLDGQGGRPTTACLVPSDLRDWTVFAHPISRWWRATCQIVRRRIVWFMLAWLVLLGLIIWGGATGRAWLSWVLAGPEGLLSSVLASPIWEWCKSQQEERNRPPRR